MRNRYYTFFLFAAIAFSALLASCTKTYESVPLGQQEPLDIAFDPNDSSGVYAMRFLLTTYANTLYDGFNRISNDNLDASTDNAVSSQSGIPPVQNIVTGSYSATSTNGDDIWTNAYAGIREATVFTVYINRVPMIEVLPDGRNARPAYRSEARFLRANLYFELLKRYGGVPLLGDTIRQIDDNTQLPRATFEECVNYIVSELDNIKDSLRTSSSVTSNTYGRVTQGAAMALKARVLLYAASPLYNGGNIDASNPLTGYTNYDQSRWQRAADAAKAVMDLGVYSLMPNFSDVFITQASPVGTNTETIFWRQNGTNTSVEVNNAPVGYTTSGSRGYTSPTQNLVDSFPTIDGLDIGDPASGYNPDKPYENRDPRLAKTVFTNGALWLNRAVQTYIGGADRPGGTIQQTKTGYYMRKFMGNFESVNGAAVYSNTYHDFVYMRYAEMLLDFAEATNEVLGPTGDVYNVLYAIRQRAGINSGADNNYGIKQSMTQDEMRSVIRKEERLEFAFEEHRTWDLKRWKTAASVFASPLKGMNIQQSSSGQLFYNVAPVLTPQFRDPQMYLYPIPYSEVLKNPSMKQNPGW